MKSPTIFSWTVTALLVGFAASGSRGSLGQDQPAPVAEKTESTKSSDSSTSTPPLSEATPEDHAAAEELLQKARSALAGHASIQADMKQQILLQGRKLNAEGTYAAEGIKLRLEYTIRVGTMEGKLVEVGDGRILHTERMVFPVGTKDTRDAQTTYTRRDIEKILGVAGEARNLPAASLAAELGIGGLPALLASLDRSMTGVRVTEEEVEGQKCQVFHGKWEESVLKNYDAAIGNYKANLVPFFPDEVRLYLSQETSLPVQVVYLKNEQNESGKITGQRGLMRLEFRNYRFDPLPPETFRYQLPSGREEVDQTEDFLKLIKQSEAALKGQSVNQAAP